MIARVTASSGTSPVMSKCKWIDVYRRGCSAARVPFSYLTTHVPAEIGEKFTRSELAARPMLELLERSGVKVERASQRIGAGHATPVVAQALGIDTGSPLIELTRIVFDRSGRGVEHLPRRGIERHGVVDRRDVGRRGGGHGLPREVGVRRRIVPRQVPERENPGAARVGTATPPVVRG